MYKTLRLDTLKKLSNFHIAESIKLKILFSIVVVSIYHLIYGNFTFRSKSVSCFFLLCHEIHLLFFFLQLAFRSCKSLVDRKLSEAKRVLCACNQQQSIMKMENHNNASIALENSIKKYFLSTADAFCLDEIENSISTQVKKY